MLAKQMLHERSGVEGPDEPTIFGLIRLDRKDRIQDAIVLALLPLTMVLRGG